MAFRRALRDPFGALSGWDPSSPLAPATGAASPAPLRLRLRLGRRRRGRGAPAAAAPALRADLPAARRPPEPEEAEPPLQLPLRAHPGSLFSRLPRLRSLFLQSNSLSGPLPDSLLVGNLSDLLTLNAASNLLSGPLPSSSRAPSATSTSPATPSPGPSPPPSRPPPRACSSSTSPSTASAAPSRPRSAPCSTSSTSGSTPTSSRAPSPPPSPTAPPSSSSAPAPTPSAASSPPPSPPSPPSRSSPSPPTASPAPSPPPPSASASSSSPTTPSPTSSRRRRPPASPSRFSISRGTRSAGRSPRGSPTRPAHRARSLRERRLRRHPAGPRAPRRAPGAAARAQFPERAVPAEIARCGALQVLDLEDNRLSGAIPAALGDWGADAVEQPLVLGPRRQRALGRDPERHWNLSGLLSLNLSKNGFSGGIPASIGSLLNLRSLDVSGQRNLSGDLPAELFGLPNLQAISLAENSFSGPVPEGFSSLVGLELLNLTANGFSGPIPATYGYIPSLRALALSRNRISGEIPAELANCSNLTLLQLRSNNLSGPIPADLSRLADLEELDLGRNDLSGKIPRRSLIALLSSCCGWTATACPVRFRSRSRGSPNCRPSISRRTTSRAPSRRPGPHPRAGLLQRLRERPKRGDPRDAGVPLRGPLGVRGEPGALRAAAGGGVRRRPAPAEEEGAAPGAAGRRGGRAVRPGRLLLLLRAEPAAVAAPVHGGQGRREEAAEPRAGQRIERGERRDGERRRAGPSAGDVRQPDHVRRDAGGDAAVRRGERAEPRAARAGVQGLLSGRHGALHPAAAVDVRGRRHRDRGGAFRKEAESLGKVKHRNLTVLRGYYAGPPPDVRLLIYDYMPNGNLATLLQEASRQDGHVLNWPMRHLIALGVARGLAFLHASGVVHGDVKPQNILFDADFEPHLSDFGLEPIVVTAGAAAAAAAASASTSTPSAAPVGPGVFAGEEEDIVKWVKRQLQRGQISELLEPGLLELDPESPDWEEFLLGVKVGLLCTAPDPADRPAMADVVFMLEGCRVGPDLPSSADPTSQPSPA
uniref:Protein kinase domain-containing protein n=1 Tax=Ananas comosus var. bracteatus TaxID=296719 RepID=A0A6V7PXD3_ANACO|nr:unnamed protein product [Ananas comosus var. bracteatus]